MTHFNASRTRSPFFAVGAALLAGSVWFSNAQATPSPEMPTEVFAGNNNDEYPSRVRVVPRHALSGVIGGDSGFFEAEYTDCGAGAPNYRAHTPGSFQWGYETSMYPENQRSRATPLALMWMSEIDTPRNGRTGRDPQQDRVVAKVVEEQVAIAKSQKYPDSVGMLLAQLRQVMQITEQKYPTTAADPAAPAAGGSAGASCPLRAAAGCRTPSQSGGAGCPRRPAAAAPGGAGDRWRGRGGEVSEALGLRTSKPGDYARPLSKMYTGWAAPVGWTETGTP